MGTTSSATVRIVPTPATSGGRRRILAERGEVAPWPWQVFVNTIAASTVVPTRLRTLLYRAAGIDTALGCRIKPGVTVRSPLLRVGRGSTVNYGCIFDNRAPVLIGERVGVGIGVTFITSTHDMSDPRCRAGAGTLQPIAIGDGAWIGSSVTVLGGISIGAGCVVAAGAVVTKDLLPHGVYAGVPAKLVRTLEADA